MSQVIQSSLDARAVAPPDEHLMMPVADETSEMEAAPLVQGEEPLTQEQLRDELAEGLMYLHSRANANTSKVLEVASFSYALIELLMERGLITVEELDERKRKVGERLVEKFTEKGMGVALTDDDRDKYAYEGSVEIDCENRLHLCRGACCRLSFALTVQDLEEGKVKWNFARPYMIRHDEDGYCHHVERETKRCQIYDGRPVICRAYDCRKDTRIWADFENKVVSPDLQKLFPAESAGEENNPTEGRPAALYQLTRNRNDAHVTSVMQAPVSN
ncbi:MAG TPA: YkgJ family cysteine cluster protein [Pyrinomonadaceae bacterium]|nr:YkgJ family cysteine cluster protein [Pyrinomonadaceae bacterium]